MGNVAIAERDFAESETVSSSPWRSVLSGSIIWLERLVLLGALIAAWELIVELGIVDEFWISRPRLVFERLYHDLVDGKLTRPTLVTMREAYQGLAMGAAAGILLGIALGFMPRVYQLLDPIIMALYALPRLAMAPLFILYFGIGSDSKIALVFGIVFFLMLLNAYSGVANVDKDLVDSVKTMGANRWFVARRVILPSSIPWIMTGLRISMVYAISGAVVGEMFLAREGLGVLIGQANLFFDTTRVFEILVVLAVLAFLSNELLKAIERRLLRWRRMELNL